MRIRPAAETDWPAVGELAESLVRLHHGFDADRFVHPDTLRPDAYIARLLHEVRAGASIVNVADEGGVVVGYVFAGIEPASWKELRHEAGYVHDLVVAETHRHGGVGRALVTSALDWLTARGVHRVLLWTAPSNAGAQRLFQAIGFRPTMIEMTFTAPGG